MARKKSEPVRQEQLHSWKLLEHFRQEVLPLLAARPLSATEQEERRTLFAEDYFCAYLFAMLNPVITGLRALCHASHCGKMRQVSRAPERGRFPSFILFAIGSSNGAASHQINALRPTTYF